MSLLVHYTLKSADDHAHQETAMTALVADLAAEGATGTDGLQYSCFATDDPVKFIGVFEFDGDAGKQAFLDSAAFATYRAAIGPTLTGPPQTTDLRKIASTRG